MNLYTFDPPPKYVGAYCIGGRYGVCIAQETKPNWFHRTMMNWCLGIEWIDYDEQGNAI